MAPVAATTARPDFVKNYSKVRCGFCSKTDPDIKPARILNKNVNTFVESKAAFKCYELVVVPLTNYISTEVMASPQLIRFCLSNIHNIADVRKFEMVRAFLVHHFAMHPPCRPGMSEYYFSVLHQHLGSFMFEKQLISDTFFDFVKRLKVAISEYVLLGSQSSSIAATYSRKEALDFLKQKCKSTNQPDQESTIPQMDMLMFVFKYCIDILIHDYESTCKTFATPLVVKMVWSADAEPDAEKPLNPHCQDIIGMYLKAPAFHRLNIARYLTLLAEVVQKGFIPQKCYFWDLGSNAIVDAFVQKFTENEGLSENALDIVAAFPSRIFQCQILQSLIYQNLLDGADYPKKSSNKNSRPKKYFPLFEKKSNKQQL